MNKETGIVNIHGKEYQTVAYRIQLFKEQYPEYSLTTEILSVDNESVIMKATIYNENFRTVATGHAEEKRNATMINKTSALENCETSAVGRALALLGLGGTEIASADELVIALNQQGNVPDDKHIPSPYQNTSSNSYEPSEKQKSYLLKLVSKTRTSQDEMRNLLKEKNCLGTDFNTLTKKDASLLIDELQNRVDIMKEEEQKELEQDVPM